MWCQWHFFIVETPRHLAKSPCIVLSAPDGALNERRRMSVCQSRLHTDDCFSISPYMHLLQNWLTRYACSFSDKWHCFHSDPQPNIFSGRTSSHCELCRLNFLYFIFFFFATIFKVISTFLVSCSSPYSPIPHPKQGASSMEDCLNLHGSNVGLQLGLWRVGLSYKPSGQIKTTCCVLGCHYSAGFHPSP